MNLTLLVVMRKGRMRVRKRKEKDFENNSSMHSTCSSHV